jgi:large conductance mechanosensitive channel
MPFVGEFTGGIDFANLKYVLTEGQGTEGEAGYVAENAMRYGAWINTIVNLIIVGLVMFLVVKAYNKSQKPEEPAPPAGPSQEDLLAEIRDLLKKQ